MLEDGKVENNDIKNLFTSNVDVDYRDTKGSQRSIKTNSSTGKKNKKKKRS